MTILRHVAALAVVVPVLVVMWVLHWAIQVMGAVCGVVRRWAEGMVGGDGAR